MEPSCVEAQDNRGTGGREPGWVLGLANKLRNQLGGGRASEFELLWWGRGHSENFGI